MDKDYYSTPFTGPETTWMITFDPQEGGHQHINFFIPYPEGSVEKRQQQWLNITELERETARYEETLRELEQLQEIVLEAEENHCSSQDSLDELNSIILRFRELLEEMMHEEEEE